MIENIRNKRSGETVAEWLPMNVAELKYDAVSLSDLISDGQDEFGLSGAQLDEFIAKSIRVMLDHGALPVIGGAGTKYFWIEQPQYGSTPDNIVTNVIKEWKNSGSGDPGLGGLWFAQPMPDNPEFVKRA
jgi:hypothetical protein